MIIYLGRTIAGRLFAGLSLVGAGTPYNQHTLQQTGFTFSCCHQQALWAFTPLVSPLPR